MYTYVGGGRDGAEEADEDYRQDDEFPAPGQSGTEVTDGCNNRLQTSKLQDKK